MKVDAGRSPIGCLDAPAEGSAVHGLTAVMGWALSPDEPSAEVELRLDGRRLDLDIVRVPRPDVVDAYPWAKERAPSGFQAVVNWMAEADGPHTLTCVVRDANREAVAANTRVRVHHSEHDAFYRRIHTRHDSASRRARLERLLELLACPACGASLERPSAGALACARCPVEYPLLDGAPVMVLGEPAYPVEESRLDSPISNHQYPVEVLDRLEPVLAAGGRALDVGAGRRSFGADGLWQVEICRYPFTDVVNQSERLPFRDEAFDLVFSLAVTEHVERPWVLAEEIQRVTRTGGEIIVDSAFLQPLHGYPSHYFNMTGSGLRSLFTDVDVLSLEPAPYQHPWFSIRWILASLTADLAPAERTRLGALTMDELLEATTRFCRGEPGPLDGLPLEPGRVDELAAGFTLYGRKAGTPKRP